MSEDNPGQATDNSDSEGEPSFIESLPEDLREEQSLADFKDVGSLAKSYVHAQKLVGRDKLPLPSDEEDELGWNEVYNRLGRPEEPDGYEFTLPDKEKDGFEIDKEFLGNFKKTMHGLGLNSRQAAKVMDFNLEFIRETKANAAAALEKQFDAATLELRKEYGQQYDRKINMADRVIKTFDASGKVMDKLTKLGLVNDPDTVRMFVKLGEQISEGDFSEAEAGMSGQTPAEARAEIAKLKLDDKFMKAYTDRYHNGHQEAVDRMRGLYQMAYPSTE